MLSIEEKVMWLEKIVLENDEMARLALGYDWTYDFVNEIYSTMELFWQKDPSSYDYGDVEEAFRERCDLGYQDLKSIFLVLYRNEQYLDVLANYLKTNAESFVNGVSLEYQEMYEKLVLSKQKK